ncbi:MAG: helix-hairpin-helix domain-containing protein [Ruminococcus sp.]|nr:helix-hairpin-helix domain-containing protein [Ruminococcus sp.]
MDEKKFRILITIIGSILIFSIFVPQILKDNRSKKSRDFIITSSQVQTTSTVITSTAIPSTSKAVSRKSKTTKTVSTDVKTTVTSVETTTAPLYLDINTASSEELQRLNGIGPVLAQAIIDFRIENGRFNNIDELLLVSGIGESIFSDIRDFVFVTDPTWPEEETEPEVEIVPEPEIISEETTVTEVTEPSSESVFPVNVNTADRDTLLLIPGITEECADEIIEVREKIGGFANEYELLLVDHLKRSQIVELLDFICFQ